MPDSNETEKQPQPVPESAGAGLPKGKWSIPVAAIFAVVPVLAYFLAYRFEVGVANYFGYPASLIVVTTERFFDLMAILLGFFVVGIVAIDVILENWPENETRQWLLPIVLILSGAAIVILYNIYPSLYRYEIIYIVAFAVLALIFAWYYVVLPTRLAALFIWN